MTFLLMTLESPPYYHIKCYHRQPQGTDHRLAAGVLHGVLPPAARDLRGTKRLQPLTASLQ